VTASERFWMRTGRYSDEQVSIVVIAGYVGAWIVVGLVAWAVFS
jgi:hypothetical protein